MKNMLGLAISIASQAFEDKVDKGGRPYILHCLWVMDKVRHLGEDAMICAALHDLIEDTDWTFERLAKEGFDEVVIKTLQLLTHDKENVTYEDYIKNIAQGCPLSPYVLAKKIKLKDLEHNLRPQRLKGLRKKDHDRIEKYHRWYVYLSN